MVIGIDGATRRFRAGNLEGRDIVSLRPSLLAKDLDLQDKFEAQDRVAGSMNWYADDVSHDFPGVLGEIPEIGTWSKAMKLTKLLGAVAVTAICLSAMTSQSLAANSPEAKAANPVAGVAAATPNRLVRDGVVIDFEARPIEGSELVEGALTELRFKLTDERSGQPLLGNKPAAWLDIGSGLHGNKAGSEQRECKEKIGLYLKGAVGIRPLVDLNGYFLLVMNRDASITVIDPMVSMAGRTNTLASIALKSPALDWVNLGELKRMYLTMPAIGKVAVVDTESFKVIADIDVGKQPTRITRQPDGKYLWIGNNGREANESGVTVIEAASGKVVMQSPTGRGHHEIAISADSRQAFVTNREEGTVTVFDVPGLKKIKDIKTGALPLSVAFSKLSGAAYVSNGKDGTFSVIDGKRLEVVKTINVKPGIGPLRFTPDGRYALAVNTAEHVVNVIDPGSNEVIQTAKVQEQPFEVNFTSGFAYVRSLGSERVSMINLTSLGAGKEPIIQSFAAGSAAPKIGGDLPLADAIAPALGEMGVFVVSPADNATYFYMEGMNAPMSSYPSRGKHARAVTVIDRSLREIEPGVFAGRFRMPVPGAFDVAFSLDQPRLVHCFGTQAKTDPNLEKLRQTVGVEFLPQTRIFKERETARLRFRVVEGTGDPKAGLKDVMVRYFLIPASAPRDMPAVEVTPGVYEVAVDMPEAGAYYVYVSVPSLKLGYNDSGFISLIAKENLALARPVPSQSTAPASAPVKIKKAEKKS